MEEKDIELKENFDKIKKTVKRKVGKGLCGVGRQNPRPTFSFHLLRATVVNGASSTGQRGSFWVRSQPTLFK